MSTLTNALIIDAPIAVILDEIVETKMGRHWRYSLRIVSPKGELLANEYLDASDHPKKRADAQAYLVALSRVVAGENVRVIPALLHPINLSLVENGERDA